MPGFRFSLHSSMIGPAPLSTGVIWLNQKKEDCMITRRGFLKASSAATAGAVTAVGNTGIARVTDKPRTFVLVHGAWHGGWCWRRVADVLRARGHRVFAPSLTGLGDRAHLFSKDISLQTHVGDILSVVEAEELSDFVLVGHSYGGFVISGVADTLREQWIEAHLHCFDQTTLCFARRYPQQYQGRPHLVVHDHRGRARLNGDRPGRAGFSVNGGLKPMRLSPPWTGI